MSTNKIDKDAALRSRCSKSLPGNEEKYDKVLQEIEKLVVAGFKKAGDKPPSGSALANARGDWYEMLVAAELWNECTTRDAVAVQLPNKLQLPFHTLYGGESAVALKRLFDVMAPKGVTLLASNPDFLVLKRPEKSTIDFKKKIKCLGVAEIKMLRTAYQEFVGKCAYSDILGAIGLKTSNRPDRRLQPVQEGSVLKAIAAHFQTRFWDSSYRVKYIAATLTSSDADDEALTTAATHTLVSVNMPIERAVDRSMLVRRPQEARDVIAAVL